MNRWGEPPRDWETLQLWKVFIVTCEAEVWQVVDRWVKKYGNPWYVPVDESYGDYAIRHLYITAMLACQEK